MLLKINREGSAKPKIVFLILALLLLALVMPVNATSQTINAVDWEVALRNKLYLMPSLFDENVIAKLQNEKKMPPDALENMIPINYACYIFPGSDIPVLIVTYYGVDKKEEKNYFFVYDSNEYIEKGSFGGGVFYHKADNQIVFVAQNNDAIHSFSYVSYNNEDLTFSEYIDPSGYDKEKNRVVDLITSVPNEIDPGLKIMLKVDTSTVSQQVNTALTVKPEYDYGDYDAEKKQLNKLSSSLEQVVGRDTAMRFIEDNVNALTDRDWEGSASLDNLVRIIELGIQRGLAQSEDLEEIALNSGSLGGSAASAEDMRKQLEENFSRGNYQLPRRFLTMLQLNSADDVSAQISYDETLRAIDFDQVTVSTPYAALTFNKSDLREEGTVSIRNRAWVQTKKEGIDPFKLWSIPAIVIISLIWAFNKGLRLRIRYWVVPAVCVLLASTNILVVTMLKRAEEATALARANEHGVALELNKLDFCILSLPVDEEASNKNDFMIYDKAGTPVFSIYNPLTRMVDAIVTESGEYSVSENNTQFLDIGHVNSLTRDSIRSLAATNIMPGTVDNMFYPDKPISRAEFVSAILRIFRQVDHNAVSTFTDISEENWYYAEVATAQKIGIIAGFEDNTFRGDVALPKAQMVFAAMQSLIHAVGYYEYRADDIDYVLSQYIDGYSIPDWSRGEIALAARIGLILNRTDYRFAPDEPMTRGDAAIMLHRILDKAW